MNGIGRDGAEAIGHALKHNRILRLLKMRACRVNVDGLILLFTRMNGNDTLNHIDVGSKPSINYFVSSCQLLNDLLRSLKVFVGHLVKEDRDEKENEDSKPNIVTVTQVVNILELLSKN